MCPRNAKTRQVAEVLDRLQGEYGRPERRRADNGVDCLVATILSQNTSRSNSRAGFARLSERFDGWDAVADAPVEQIAEAIRVSGLGRTKAPRIRRILRSIRRDRGTIDLEHLGQADPDQAFEYLLAFEGVGPKTAWCVLLFGFGMDVLPVDTHIHRIAIRLGWIEPNISAEAAHDLLGPLVPDGRRYDLHVLLIQHGRTTCKARNARCGVCCLTDLCDWYDRNVRN
jgi:endonuclease-3